MPTATHPDPCRVVCAGDWLTAHRRGACESFERLCRIHRPDQAWKFWHLGDPTTTAEEFLHEALWKALGLGAGRLILSLGGAESLGEDFDPATTANSIRRCMELLADKGPQRLHLILPCPSLWIRSRRAQIEQLRQELLAPLPRWTLIDLEPRAAGFLEAQSHHPDLAAALVEDSDSGPALTALGALLVADELHKAFAA